MEKYAKFVLVAAILNGNRPVRNEARAGAHTLYVSAVGADDQHDGATPVVGGGRCVWGGGGHKHMGARCQWEVNE